MQDPPVSPALDAQDQHEAEEDAKLMHAITAGDAGAFQRLVQRHLAKTVRLAQRLLGPANAEDIAQEAFVRVWRHAERFEDPAQRGARFSTWLYRIVFNLCIDERRKNRGSRESIDDVPEIADNALVGEDMLAQKERVADVRAAVADLPERQRTALVLCFYEGRTNQEAAEIMGIGIKAVESLLVRARQMLRQRLKDKRVNT